MSDFQFNTSDYPTALGALIPESDECPLNAGEPNGEISAMLRALDLDAVFAPRKIVQREMAKACHAGLWLIHGFLDESHSISQDLKNPTGSYWHGIMHRREGDFSNAKYWFGQADEHPLLTDLGADVAKIVGETPADKTKLTDASGRFDPAAFVDRCNASARGDDLQDEALRKLARREWERLFDWCYRQAIGE